MVKVTGNNDAKVFFAHIFVKSVDLHQTNIEMIVAPFYT